MPDIDGIAAGTDQPTVGGSTDLWGGEQNAITQTLALEAKTKTTNLDYDDKELQKPLLKDYGELASNPSSSTNTITLDVESGNHFYTVLDEDTTVTLSNPTATDNKCAITWNIAQDVTGSRLVTWPASVDWGTVGEPVLTTTANKMDIIYLETLNGGANWCGSVVGKGFVKNFTTA